MFAFVFWRQKYTVIFFNSRKNEDISLFLGLLVPLYWTSGDACPDYLGHGGSPRLRAFLLAHDREICFYFAGESDKSHSNSAFDMTKVSPGAYAAQPEALPTSSSAYAERMTMDINMLKKQYKKLRERQQQAHIILTCK